MRPLPPLLLVPLALLLLLPQARGSACPARCDCALDGSPLELVCRRAGGRGRVELQGERTKYLNVICKQDASNFTCEDVPEFDFGRNGTLEELSFSRCPLEGLSVACVAARVGAREVLSLTVEEPPGGPRLLPGHVRGLRGVRRVFLQGREERDEEIDVPWSAVELLPDLEQLAVTSVRARLGSGSGAASSGSGAASSGSGAASSGSGAPRLRRLEVSMARLPAPPPGAFAGLPALTELSLFRNDIDNITQDMFQNLTSLEVLDLSSNQLSELDGNALAGCPRLRELLAYDNPLQQLRPLAPLPHLQKVEIFECSPASLEVQPGALGALPRLQHVILRACGVLALPPDALAGSAALLTLDLSENQLTSLPATLFADQKALQALDLSGNQLESLPRDLLWSLGALQRLNLDDNRLLELPDRFVEGLPLRDLSAAGNQLQHLTRATFAGAGALQHLDLSRNNLTQETDGQYWNLEMVASPFNALLKLQTLDLSYNALTALPQDIAPALLHLTSLNMSHNNITYITDLDNSLTFLSPNVTVDLRDNQISVVELSPALWRAAPTPGYASRVLLQGNPLRCDCRLYQLVRRVRGWSGAATLPTLVAADVTCAATPSVVGKPLANLTDADLACDIPATDCVQGCSCFRLPLTIALTCKERFDALPEHFDTFPLELKLQFPPESLSWLPPNVKTLDLSNLNITEVPDFNFTAIKSVDLRGNELTSVPVGMLDANATVWVSGNPLACDCWRAGAVRALQASAAAGRVPDWPAAACSGGGPARLVDPSRLCRHLALAVGSALLAVLGLLSAVAAVLLLRYSMHVKVFLYARGWCRCWVREDRDQGRFEYDAFVSFAHEDASLVMEQLLPGLEGGPRPFKVCVHYRDWIAGEWIPAQIAQSVERSRYTIVVVSKHFLDSKWGRLEFRAANMSAIREKRARVIVVLLEDVAGHPELDAELRAYFATNTYLKWNDPWFWDRLRYALRHKAEARMRRAGQRLAQLMGDQGDQCKKAGLIGGGDHPNGGKTGGLDTQLAPNGKILNAAIKAKEHKISGIV